MVALKEAEQKAYALLPEKRVLAELNWQLPEFSKLSFICKQSKKHTGSRDTVTSGTHDFPGSARSCRALYYPPLCGGRASDKGDGVGGTVTAVSKWGCGEPTQPAHTPCLCLQPLGLPQQTATQMLDKRAVQPETTSFAPCLPCLPGARKNACLETGSAAYSITRLELY